MSRSFTLASSDYARYTAAIALSALPFTLFGYVKISAIGSTQHFGGIYKSTSDDDYCGMAINGTGNPSSVARDLGSGVGGATSANVLSAGTWYFLAAEFSGTGSTLASTAIVDGTIGGSYTRTSTALTRTLLLSTMNRTSVGRCDRNTTQQPFGGLLAYFGWLSAIPIAADYTSLLSNAPHVVFGANKVHYWRMDGNVSPETDSWDSADLTLTSPTYSTDNPSINLGGATTATMGRCIYVLP